ncbi:hypothetical protein UFOVP93_11 [uncultured Caudovirales phage]|uniref:Uncharacterized protein n=1 Tax=uncultured Caudovirales phage TaxID=2100421 RepID=A0A6J5L376_9CAUD|nr:hypothetical protein UFOVP93_11 [uncultured Caudovirales phage]
MPIRSMRPSQRFLNHFKTERKIEMPLVKGAKAKSRKGFSANVKAEMDAGKKQSQAVAIAYAMSRKSKTKDKNKHK